MAIDVASDIPELLSDFGVTVTKADTSTFTAIFVNEYEAQSVYGMDIDSSVPLLTCKSTDVSSLLRGDVLTIDSVDYNILSLQPDDTGVTVLALGQD